MSCCPNRQGPHKIELFIRIYIQSYRIKKNDNYQNVNKQFRIVDIDVRGVIKWFANWNFLAERRSLACAQISRVGGNSQYLNGVAEKVTASGLPNPLIVDDVIKDAE